MSLLKVKQLTACANGCTMGGNHQGQVRFGDYELHLAGHMTATLCVQCAREAERIWFENGGNVYRRGALKNRWSVSNG
jgi:hypothetical protein